MNTLVTNIRQLVTPLGTEPTPGKRMKELSIREDVHLLLRGDRVVAVSDERPTIDVEAVIDAAGGVVIPGLIDPFLWAAGPSSPTPPESAHPDPPDVPRGEPLDRSMVSAFAQAVRHGTTTAEVRILAGAGWQRIEETLACVELAARQSSVRVAACVLGAPARTPNGSSDDRISTLIGETIPGIQRHRLASSCAALCGEGGYSRKEAKAVLRAARGAGLDVKVQSSGAGADAILLAAELEAATVDDLVRCSRPELDRLQRAGVIPILLPGDPFLSDHPWAEARRMLEAGLAVALGSAAHASGAGILSMATVLSLAVRKMGLDLAEALTAVTLNAAGALGLARVLGTIEPGKQADFLVLDLDDHRRIADFVVGLPVRHVIIGGRVACTP
ncbi:MAG: amidohydrolase family protein [Candidatus Bipolaricaulis sp.]|nr:amidohydrolase family protein [Candidatus Bipolaricaulis sp.]